MQVADLERSTEASILSNASVLATQLPMDLVYNNINTNYTTQLNTITSNYQNNATNEVRCLPSRWCYACAGFDCLPLHPLSWQGMRLAGGYCAQWCCSANTYLLPYVWAVVWLQCALHRSWFCNFLSTAFSSCLPCQPVLLQTTYMALYNATDTAYTSTLEEFDWAADNCAVLPYYTGQSSKLPFLAGGACKAEPSGNNHSQ